MTLSLTGLGTMVAGTGAISVQCHTGTLTGDQGILMVISANQTIAAPTGDSGTWVEIAGSPQGTGTAGAAGGVRLAVFTTTFTQAYGAGHAPCSIADTGDFTAGRIFNARGFMGIEASAGSVIASATTSVVFPSVTVAMPDAWIMNICATDEDTATDIAARLSNFTNADMTSPYNWLTGSTATGTGGGIFTYDGVANKTGTIAQSTVTHSTSQVFACITIAFNQHTQTLKGLSPPLHAGGSFVRVNNHSLSQIIKEAPSVIHSIGNILSQKVSDASVRVVKSAGNIITGGLKETSIRVIKSAGNVITQKISDAVSLKKNVIQILSQAIHAGISFTKNFTSGAIQYSKTLLAGVKKTVSIIHANNQTLSQTVKGSPSVIHGITQILSQTVKETASFKRVNTQTLSMMMKAAILFTRTNNQTLSLTAKEAVSFKKDNAQTLSQTVKDAVSFKRAIVQILSQKVSGLIALNHANNQLLLSIVKGAESVKKGSAQTLSQTVKGAVSFVRSSGQFLLAGVKAATSFVDVFTFGVNQFTKMLAVNVKASPLFIRISGKITTVVVDMTQVRPLKSSTKRTITYWRAIASLSKRMPRSFVAGVDASARFVKAGGKRFASGIHAATGFFKVNAQKITSLLDAGISTLKSTQRSRSVKIQSSISLLRSTIKRLMVRADCYVWMIKSIIVNRLIKIDSPVSFQKRMSKTAITGLRFYLFRLSLIQLVRSSGIRLSDFLTRGYGVIVGAMVGVSATQHKVISVFRRVQIACLGFGSWMKSYITVSFVKIAGVWMVVEGLYHKIDGIWKQTALYKKINGGWQ